MSPSHQQEPTSLREEADNLRQEGNEIFKTSKVFREYKSAVQKYAKALDRSRLAGANPEFETKLYSNIALCQLRMGEWTNSISNSDVVLSRNPDDPKALYRRALVNVELDHPVRAIADFRHAANAAPEDAAVKRELIRVEKEFAQVMAKHRQQFAEVYNVMLHSDVFKQPIPE